jgi:hypothetical protein
MAPTELLGCGKVTDMGKTTEIWTYAIDASISDPCDAQHSSTPVLDFRSARQASNPRELRHTILPFDQKQRPITTHRLHTPSSRRHDLALQRPLIGGGQVKPALRRQLHSDGRIELSDRRTPARRHKDLVAGR